MFWKLLIALVIGALQPIALAPFNIYSASFILPAILLFMWLRVSSRQAFWLGWLYGIGFFGTGASWIYISIHNYGNASALLSVLITLLFCLFLALFFAALGYCFRKLFSHVSIIKQSLLIFPALWVIFEYLRSVLFTGFPWLLIGYAQINTPLSGLSPLIGIYGLSLVTVIISGALVVLLLKKENFPKTISLCLIFGLIGLGYALQNHAWTKPIDKPLTVSLIQGNIPQTAKWDPSYIIQNVNIYKHLTFDHLSTSQLIVWPEGAFPIYADEALPFIKKLGMLAKKNHSNIIFGVPLRDADKKNAYNGLLLIGDNDGKYLKRHLVPFGEYTPLSGLFTPLTKYFNIPMSDFSQGPADQGDLKIGNVTIAPFICYEIIYPWAVLNTAKHSELLMTLSDDSWFGHSIALAQHLQMAQMRSLEMGRFQMVSTNTGISAFISPFGKILKSTPIDQRVVITETIQPMTGKTPLMWWGYYPVAAIVVIFVIMGLI